MKLIWLTAWALGWLNPAAQVPNAKTETVRIAGICDRCKQAIESSGSGKKKARVAWDVETGTARITYDPANTTLDAILKRIAYAGYDNARYLAPPEAYARLDSCCRYERAYPANVIAAAGQPETVSAHADHQTPDAGQQSPVDRIVAAYLKLKDALVAGNAEEASRQSSGLAKQLQSLKTAEALQARKQAQSLAGDGAIEAQRAQFAALSETIHALVKAEPPTTPLFYQHCPMYNKGKGANWLSAEKAIRNPYYGDQMLTCGSTVETLGSGK